MQVMGKRKESFLWQVTTKTYCYTSNFIFISYLDISFGLILKIYASVSVISSTIFPFQILDTGQIQIKYEIMRRI